jgi:hypothetical protein
MMPHDVKVAFASLRAAGTFRKLADGYRQSALLYPKHADADMAEAARMKASAQFHIRLATMSEGPRLP